MALFQFMNCPSEIRWQIIRQVDIDTVLALIPGDTNLANYLQIPFYLLNYRLFFHLLACFPDNELIWRYIKKLQLQHSTVETTRSANRQLKNILRDSVEANHVPVFRHLLDTFFDLFPKSLAQKLELFSVAAARRHWIICQHLAVRYDDLYSEVGWIIIREIRDKGVQSLARELWPIYKNRKIPSDQNLMTVGEFLRKDPVIVQLTENQPVFWDEAFLIADFKTDSQDMAAVPAASLDVKALLNQSGIKPL